MMKTILLLTTLLISFAFLNAQNINDNDVSFSYIQLPLIQIDDDFSKYEVRVEHGYLQANEDSLILFELRQKTAMDNYEQSRILYQTNRDALERQYLKSLSTWEKQVNAGALTATGLPLPKPNPPVFPEPPMYPNVEAVQQHSAYDENSVKQAMKIDGFEQGMGGMILTINILPIRNINIAQTVKGTGSATKYHYQCSYVLPVEIKLESPTQGVVLQQTMMENTRTYGMAEQKSQYDHQLYMLDNKDKFFSELELNARRGAINEANDYINNQVGFVPKKRNTEIYSVKAFKSYDYQDVTNAYSATMQALSLVGNDRDRSGAQEKLAEAMKMWDEIMFESNTYDDKARINDKVSAMIQCNMAEIMLWQSKFNEANSMLNLIENTKVLKARTHAKRMDNFYEEREKRWNANF